MVGFEEHVQRVSGGGAEEGAGGEEDESKGGQRGGGGGRGKEECGDGVEGVGCCCREDNEGGEAGL